MMKWQIFYCALFFIATVESRWLLDRICDYELKESHGLITSPNYPHNYPSPVICTYKIIQPLERIISVALSHTDLGWNETHDCSGRLEIYDGDDDLAPKLDTFCGTDYFIPSRVINSTTNALFMKLESYSSSQENIGFQALYKTTNLQCGGLFKKDKGMIQHPALGGNYKRNENCNWMIQAPPGHTIRIDFTKFDMGTTADFLNFSELYEGRMIDIIKVITNINGGKPPPSISTKGRFLYINFKSAATGNVSSGFKANYTFVNAMGFN